jgi:ribosome-binding ATPase YchF (GTP1/OBG family)
VEDSLRKPVPKLERDALLHEDATLKTVLAAVEQGKPLRESDMTDDQLRVTRSFRLFGEKPRVVFFNTGDDEAKPERFTALGTPQTPVVAIPAGLELELARMTPEDRAEFQKEMGVGGADREGRPPADEDLRPAALPHGWREGSPHLALARRRHRPGRRRRDPHRPG